MKLLLSDFLYNCFIIFQFKDEVYGYFKKNKSLP